MMGTSGDFRSTQAGEGVSPLQIEYRAIETLRPQKRNPRTHGKGQIKQLAWSIKTFGFTNPVLIDDEGGILAGHGRVEAAKQLGLVRVPTVRLSGMSLAQRKAYVIADNRLAQNAGWDQELLSLELAEIAILDIGLDLTVTGFETAEIDIALASAKHDAPEPPVAIDLAAPVVSQKGDLWLLGKHRLICGDARDSQTYARLMAGTKARVVFTDPPYNVKITGHVGGLGDIRHTEFLMASGEMSEAEFTAFLHTVFRLLVENSVDGSIHFICMDWRHLFELLTAGRATYTELKNVCVWTKTNAGMGSLYRSQHELVPVFKSGKAPHINTVELGRHGRYRTNVWSYAGANSFGPVRMADLRLHPTVKPVEMVADAICDVSRRGDIVLDPFLGSGTTLIAADQVGRIAYAVELEPRYVDATVRRWQARTREEAVLEATGVTFATCAAQRQNPGLVRDGDPEWMR